MTPTIPGLEVCEATHDDFVSSMAGDLELQPVPKVLPVYPAKRLHAPAGNEAERNFERSEVVRASLRPPVFNDWARSRASTDAAHRHAVAMGDCS